MQLQLHSPVSKFCLLLPPEGKRWGQQHLVGVPVVCLSASPSILSDGIGSTSGFYPILGQTAVRGAPNLSRHWSLVTFFAILEKLAFRKTSVLGPTGNSFVSVGGFSLSPSSSSSIISTLEWLEPSLHEGVEGGCCLESRALIRASCSANESIWDCIPRRMLLMEELCSTSLKVLGLCLS